MRLEAYWEFDREISIEELPCFDTEDVIDM